MMGSNDRGSSRLPGTRKLSGLFPETAPEVGLAGTRKRRRHQRLDRVLGKETVVLRKVPGDFDTAGMKGGRHGFDSTPYPSVRMSFLMPFRMTSRLHHSTHRAHQRIVFRSVRSRRRPGRIGMALRRDRQRSLSRSAGIGG